MDKHPITQKVTDGTATIRQFEQSYVPDDSTREYNKWKSL
jgi:hypothetical protein